MKAVPFRVLVVEDEAVVAMDIESRLRSMGYEVAGRADTAASAVESAETVRPDLVLMDIRLRDGSDGIEAAAEIAERLELPVVFLTAHADEGTLERAKHMGPAGYLLKPFSDRDLRMVMEMAVFKHRADLEIRRLNRLYESLSRVNRAMVEVRSVPDYLEEVCRVTVETGRFDFAWVGRHQSETGVLETVGAWGRGAASVERLPELAVDRKPGSPSHRAYMEGARWVGRVPEPGRDREDCARAVFGAGLREMAALPLRVGGRAWGVFSVYSSDAGDFGPRELGLLEEVAVSIGFGVEQSLKEAERVRAEAEVREQRRLFETLIEVLPTPVYLTDTGGCYLRCNEAFARFVGRSKEEILHRGVDEVVPADLAPGYRQADDEVFRRGRGGTYRYTSQVSREDGTRRDVVFHKAALCGADGVPTGIVGVILDITDLKDRERVLRESERRFRTLIQKSADVVGVLDVEGVVRFNSASVERAFGYREEEVVGRGFSGWVHPEDQPGWAGVWAELGGAVGGQRAAVFRLRHRDGSWRWVEATLTNLLDDPEIRGVVMNYRDITERVAAEREVRHREAELAAIYDSAPFMMCLVDRDGRVVRANRLLQEAGGAVAGGARLWREGGVAAGAGAGAEVEVEAVGVGRLGEAVREAFVTRRGRQGWEVSLGAGVLAPAEVHVAVSTAFLEVGSSPLVLLCVEDITRRRGLEAQFLQAQKMEAVGQMAGGIAHDFNNILAAMLMNLGVLRNPARTAAEPGEAVAELERLAHRAADLTRQLLLFGRRKTPQVARVDLNGVLAGVTRMLRRLLGDHIEMQLSCAPGEMWVDVDAGMIEQAVMNLALNARDAMPQGGCLVVGTARLRRAPGGREARGSDRPGWFVCLRVTDTGSGMDEAVLARIFEPFFTTKESGRGTGLGLPTVQGIVEQHRGWIEVESRVGRGSTFLVYLPAASGPMPPRVEGADRREAPPGAVRGGTESVLVVEDAPAVRRMVVMTLRSFGYRVVEASHGQEAIERWLQDPGGVDLLLTDMVMPGGMTGLQLIERLRQLRPDLPALVSSG